MKYVRTTLAAAAVAVVSAGLGLTGVAGASASTTHDAYHRAPAGAVYVLGNQPSGNAVVAYDRAADGTLSPAGSYATGGTGTGAGLGS